MPWFIWRAEQWVQCSSRLFALSPGCSLQPDATLPQQKAAICRDSALLEALTKPAVCLRQVAAPLVTGEVVAGMAAGAKALLAEAGLTDVGIAEVKEQFCHSPCPLLLTPTPGVGPSGGSRASAGM